MDRQTPNPALLGALAGLRPPVPGPAMPGPGMPLEAEPAPIQQEQPTTTEAPLDLLDDQHMVDKALELLQKYKAGKQALETRIIENEQWYRQRHWDVAGRSKNLGDPEPASGWLFNNLANKHADAMDHYPSLAVLPREMSDQQDADVLSSVLPVVLEQNEYEQVYSDMWWYKLRTGTGVTGVFWDSSKLGGLGDITVRSLDLLNLFWEPGITNIQDSQNVFYVSLTDGESLRAQYPQLKDATGGATLGDGAGGLVAQYVRDESIDQSGKLLMIDWYYKRWQDGRQVLHLCKICAGKVLFASEREPQYQSGYYDHGKYPFVLDALFPMPESPAGFGFIDIGKSAQVYIDRLDQALLKNTIIGARPRWWVKGDGMVNVDEYADMSNDFVHFQGTGKPEESVYQIQIPTLNPYAVTMRQNKIDELKEVSGNRDFSQGGTSGGITAFSAIQALKEAGSKLSRDMIASSYRAFAQVGYLCIDLMRQFYEEARTFRITGSSGQTEFATFSGRQIGMRPSGDGFMQATRLPVFDIKVSAMKADPFDANVQNERAQTLYQMGFFNPQTADQALLALEMMNFDGIDQLKSRISRNSGLYQQMQALQQQVLQLNAQLQQQGMRSVTE